MLQDLKEMRAQVLIPSHGPLLPLLISLGVSREVILLSNSSKYFFSNASTLILRQPPFNIIQAHWPSNYIAKQREHVVKWLVQAGFINVSSSRNVVIYLSRRNTFRREVQNELSLLKRIKQLLKPGLELIVIGENNQLSYESEDSRESWMRTADIFHRAVAVIGPHGGAFGNIFLCESPLFSSHSLR
jgi:capsular polysaccharide biosynthesis protein